jgi:calcium/proton exchanger cax
MVIASPDFQVPTNQISSQLSGDAIEQISLSLGHTFAGLLNASFGNVIEIIVGITALLQGEYQIVQTAVRVLPSSVLV